MSLFYCIQNAPSWKAFSKVVTSLLKFTRTKKGQYEWIQLVGHPGNISLFIYFELLIHI
jgi:hypothetical protein